MISFFQLIRSIWRILSTKNILLIYCMVVSTILLCLLLNSYIRKDLTVIHKSTPLDRSNYNDVDGTIYIITPTYSRYVQLAELTRLSHTFMLVPKIHWLIVEDSNYTTELINNFVARLRYRFNFRNVTNLFAPTPSTFKRKLNEPDWKYPKGVWQRNRALEWIGNNLNSLHPNDVLYFADDDNTYDLELFDEMKITQKVSVWPVGLVGNLVVEKPIVQNGIVISFNAIWDRSRSFPLDMAGFAVNLSYYLKRGKPTFSSNQTIGHMESHFLGQLVESWNELEPRADECRKVLVWHTKTRNPRIRLEKRLPLPLKKGIDL